MLPSIMHGRCEVEWISLLEPKWMHTTQECKNKARTNNFFYEKNQMALAEAFLQGVQVSIRRSAYGLRPSSTAPISYGTAIE